MSFNQKEQKLHKYCLNLVIVINSDRCSRLTNNDILNFYKKSVINTIIKQ